MNNAVPYNNNMFSLKGRLHRTAYIFQNLLLNILGFRFLYFPAMAEAFHHTKSNPQYKFIIDQLSHTPNFAFLFTAMENEPSQSMMIIIIKYLFIIPFRMIDIKRVRDLVDRELSTGEILSIAVIFTLPYVDFFTTLGLSLLPALYYADKKKLTKQIKEVDLKSANDEKFQELNRKLFESGKISRADFIKARDKHKGP